MAGEVEYVDLRTSVALSAETEAERARLAAERKAAKDAELAAQAARNAQYAERMASVSCGVSQSPATTQVAE